MGGQGRKTVKDPRRPLQDRLALAEDVFLPGGERGDEAALVHGEGERGVGVPGRVVDPLGVDQAAGDAEALLADHQAVPGHLVVRLLAGRQRRHLFEAFFEFPGLAFPQEKRAIKIAGYNILPISRPI